MARAPVAAHGRGHGRTVACARGSGPDGAHGRGSSRGRGNVALLVPDDALSGSVANRGGARTRGVGRGRARGRASGRGRGDVVVLLPDDTLPGSVASRGGARPRGGGRGRARGRASGRGRGVNPMHLPIAGSGGASPPNSGFGRGAPLTANTQHGPAAARGLVPGTAKRYVPRTPLGALPRGRPRDSWFPYLSPTMTTVNRKKRKASMKLHRSKYEDHVVMGPLERDWQGYSVAFAESLKVSYAARSYCGPSEFLCQYCGASFWFAECVQSKSSWTKRKIIYNLCCKGAQVYIPPFKDPPAYLRELLRFDGTSRAKKFLRNIRQYNCMFAFTSMGAKIDHSLDSTRGPKVFKISGQVSHRIGSLLPKGSDSPKFAELYIHDPANEISHRINALNPNDKPVGAVDESIVIGLRDMLDEFNPLVQTFREASKLIEDRADEPIEDISIRIIGPSDGDSPQFSLPTATGLATLVVNDFTLEASARDIVVSSRSEGLQQISSLNTAFMPLQYPLLFPYGERGFQIDVPHLIVPQDDDPVVEAPHVEASTSDASSSQAPSGSRNRMTMQDYYRFMCHYKGDQPNPYLCYGLLSSQAVVDARACIDENRLWYILRNQDKLRSEHMQGITDAVSDGCADGDALGKRTILPSSHTGGGRYFKENFQDGLAVCRVHGPPDIFTTFTCNPKWPEIMDALEPGQRPSDRADIVVRVYHMKLIEYLNEIKFGQAFGPIKAVLYTVEFQKRGLPHAHILVWRKGDKGEVGVESIDSFISAEIPDPLADPLGYALVSEFMMHGPCGEMNDKCICMKKGSCSKYFPKEFRDSTIIDEHGFALYRRRDDGRKVYKNGHYLDNRHVVPYNMLMLKKFQGHINVEWCNKTQVMKYLFKYVTKGADYSKVVLERLEKSGATGFLLVDEVKEYLMCRYICEYDALWRIFGYDIHFKMPSVERLTVHMPGMNIVRYRDGADITKIAGSNFLKKTMLTEWFVANELYEHARSFTYCDFPIGWTWDAKSRSWHERGGGEKIGRVYYVHPTSGELYYLRMLLMIVKGARSFEELRTYGGRLYHTFKEACAARGLLGDDSEWYMAFDEAVIWGFGHRLRQLFVTMLIRCSIKDEMNFFERYWVNMSDDIKHGLRRLVQNPSYSVPDERLRDMLLDELAEVFLKHGSSISNFNMPSRTGEGDQFDENRLIREELSYDAPALARLAPVLIDSLNVDQSIAYKTIVDCVQAGEPGFFFVSGYGGTGKTYLWNAICAFLRGEKKIVLTVASSGIASLLLPGGRTAHSRFKIPTNIDDDMQCDIKRGSRLCRLMMVSSLIIWDEALMTHRKCFEAVDRTLRDVLSMNNPDLADIPFGGIVMVLGGDLRQILPVIEGGTRPQIIDAAITNSTLWHSVKKLSLSINMRLVVPGASARAQEDIALFSKWVLDLGEGKLLVAKRGTEDGASWIQIPDDLLIHTDGDPIAAIVSSVYAKFSHNYLDTGYLQERAILAPTNDYAEEINIHVMDLVPTASRDYLSADSIDGSGGSVREENLFYPIEYLNTIKIINFPNHRLTLKIGVPIMLIRNLCQANGLCNGTRLIVKDLSDHVIEAVIITGSHVGDCVYIPRIELTAKQSNSPFVLRRRQFPVRVCYAMTINKSQGQTLSAVGIYLKSPVFTHGQLYVAVSRVTSRASLKILIVNEDGTCGSETKNVVFPEVFRSAGMV